MAEATSFHRQPASLLLELLGVLEQNLIAGVAEAREIDAYVELQLELSGRNRLDFILDARD